MPPKGWKKSGDPTDVVQELNTEPVQEMNSRAPKEMTADSVPATTPRRKPRITVLERRLQNPFGEPSAPISFKTPGLDARWFNSAVRADQFWRARELGWEKVTEDMLADPNQIGMFTKAPDNSVCRGERSQEVLMYMPSTDRRAIAMAKTLENRRLMGNPGVQKQQLVEALGQQDPEGAEFLHDHVRMGGGPSGTVTDNYERIQVDPDPAG